MFSIKDIIELIKQVDQSSLSEFTYEADGFKIVLKKNGAVNHITTQPQVNEESTVVQVKEKTEEIKEVPEKVEAPAAAKDDAHYHEITAPMVGTFYAAPAPDAEPYVKVGSKVKKDTVVCIVEAMKLFNEIEAEVEGEIVEILVENGQLVEYGQPLFLVKLD